MLNIKSLRHSFPQRSTPRLKILNNLVIALISLYQISLAGLLGGRCRFDPSCSSYAREAFRQHGFFSGLKIALSRFGRCHPFGGYGYDPVKKNKSHLGDVS